MTFDLVRAARYVVKEMFYTLQGEGANAGRPAVFVRFSGCNLWSGREKDRATSTCTFCDTDFVGGERFAAEQLASMAEDLFPSQHDRFVVFTGGEPALQLDQVLLDAFRRRHFFTAIETNGTVTLKATPDWITVSPKTRDLKITHGDELKLIVPQTLGPEAFSHLSFARFYLQPKWEWGWWRRQNNLRSAIELCHRWPQWRLSQQNHKRWGLR